MKLFNKKSFAALAVLGALSIGTASAMSTTSMPLTSIVGVSSASVQVRITDGVATLFGNVESGSEAAIAQAYVANLDNVDKVINQLLIN